MKKYLIILVLCVAITHSYGQTLQKNILNTCGSSALRLQYSVGEAIVGNLVQTGGALQQGFLAGRGKLILPPAMPVNADSINTYPLALYPNPVTTLIYFKGDRSNIHQVQAINAIGQILFTRKLTTGYLDLSRLQAGIYILKLYDHGSRSIGVYKIIKR